VVGSDHLQLAASVSRLLRIAYREQDLDSGRKQPRSLQPLACLA
jgi:hypothetical protein